MVARGVLHAVLDRLETEESRLLAWGDTGGFFSLDEVLRHIREVVPDQDPAEVLDIMLDSVMIYRIPEALGREAGYRSRMSESVYLFRHLRQWFAGQSLFETKTLVSDFRFVRRPRAYPLRDIDADDVLRELDESGVPRERYEETFRRYLGTFKLSGFQLRAMKRILKAYEAQCAKRTASSGTIVSAGTGSGKTLAFYLPALTALVDDISNDSERRVRVLAVYPRNELLKDQFNEASTQCRKLNDSLRAKGQRPIRIGALFGDTPQKPQDVFGAQRKRGGDWIRCYEDGCSGRMRSPAGDADPGKESLTCSACGAVTERGSIALSRLSMRQDVPDIIFTTTEMLNIHLASPSYRKLFGVESSRPPISVLLDEVHTYSGTHGAHVAYLLRRWKKLAKGSSHFVGLSATLTDAEDFFARLTGINRSRVRMIEASDNELVEEGAEYLLALRGDPVSQTALLSTTIQSAMLIRRVLDHPTERASQGTWGTKTFIFTDNLDVTNRLFWQLCDAEGWAWAGGRLAPNRNGPLAALRGTGDGNSESTRKRLGQDWGITKAIGYSLDSDDRARIDRTSSQDSGVDPSAEIIVATASLEVGYNDPDVGAVLQHKSPRDTASYLQRKGRAGRPRGMRPWTIAVLSDYGRDRLLYQNYEKLVSPRINLQRLPLENSHIYRMQAAIATLEWLGLRLGRGLWMEFNFAKKNRNVELYDRIADLIDKCIVPGLDQDALRDHIRSALGLDERQLARVMWQSPRSILLEFLPLLRRRLRTKWAAWNRRDRVSEPWGEANIAWRSPVPEHIPDQLFSDLNLPTLVITLKRGHSVQEARMGFFQGLSEFAPGRISKRFSLTSSVGADWLVPSGFDDSQVAANAVIDFDVDEAFTPTRTRIGSVVLKGGDAAYSVSQPHFINPTAISKFGQLSETSNARLLWETVVRPPIRFEAHPPPRGAKWSRFLREIAYFLHSQQSQLEIMRVSTGARTELKYRSRRGNAKRKLFDFRWTELGEPAGVGTRLWVDALRCTFVVEIEDLQSVLGDPETALAVRASLFEDGILELSRFRDDPFTAKWVAECFIAGAALESVLSGCDAEDATRAVLENRARVALSRIPGFVFQPGEQGDSADDLESRTGVIDLEKLLTEGELLTELGELSECLYVPLEQFEPALAWARRLIANTLAAGIHNAACTVLPDMDEASVVADSTIQGSSIQVFLSERESGGSGAIAQLHERYSADPIAVLNVFAQTLEPSEYERVDSDIRDLLVVLSEEPEFAQRIADVRSAATFEARVAASEALKSSLRSAGFHVSQSFGAVLYTRILRPGSDKNTDAVLQKRLFEWENLEAALGFEVPLSVAALVQSLREVGDGESSGKVYERTCRIQGLLWPRGGAVRQNSLQSYNRFATGPARIDRAIVAPLLSDRSPRVELSDPSWLRLVHEKLLEHGRVELCLGRADLASINRHISCLQVAPLETYGLYFYPRVASLKRYRDEFIVVIDFAEAVH